MYTTIVKLGQKILWATLILDISSFIDAATLSQILVYDFELLLKISNETSFIWI